MKKILLVSLIVISGLAFGGWFDKKPMEKDVTSAVLSGRGDDLKFLMNQHNINPSSVKTEKSSVDGVWKVSYEVKDPSTGTSTKYVSNVTTYERKNGKGLGLHFVNTEREKEPAPLSFYEERRISNEGEGDLLKAEQATLTVCGFTFGENYLNWGKQSKRGYIEHVREGELGKPFRYLTHARLFHDTESGCGAMLQILDLVGDVPESMTREERNAEAEAVAKILAKKYGVELKHVGDGWRYCRFDSAMVKEYTNYELSVFPVYESRSGKSFEDNHWIFRVRVKNNCPIRDCLSKKKPKVEKRSFTASEGADAL